MQNNLVERGTFPVALYARERGIALQNHSSTSEYAVGVPAVLDAWLAWSVERFR